MKLELEISDELRQALQHYERLVYTPPNEIKEIHLFLIQVARLARKKSDENNNKT